MTSAIQTFLTCDSRYITPLSVMVFSILKNANPERELHIHIAHDQSFADKGCRDVISSLCARYPFATAHFHNADEFVRRRQSVLSSKLDKVSSIFWAGPLLADVLPQDVTGKIVYLDVDMLVLTRLDELADLDLGQNVAAAVVEGDRRRFAYLEACEWPAAARAYYNNGTMVVDLDRYRQLRICERIVEWYAKYGHAAICTDQDSQNAVFGDRIVPIPPKWNYNDGWLSRIVRLTPFTKTIRAQPRAAVLEAINGPCIIHYIASKKPWAYTRRPTRRIYHQYMRELGVFDPAVNGTTLRQKLELALHDAYNDLLAAYARLLWAVSRPAR